MGSVSLFKNDHIVYSKQLGFANIETKKKPNDSTKYRIGSISKTVTATLVFKAVEEGLLNLNDTIANYFPTLPNANTITIRHLLSHSSGIGDYTNNSAFLEYRTEPRTKQEMLVLISKSGQNFKPGIKHEYSNSNYLLLSYILQDVYNKPYGEIANEKIIRPLNLKHTYLSEKINANNNEAYSYLFLEQWNKAPETNASLALGAGSLAATPNDLLVFAHALFSSNIISKEHVTLMSTINESFGLGLFAMPYYDKFCLGHGGKIDGFNSLFGYFPDDKIGFAIMSNGTNFDNNQIAIALLNAVFNKPITIPTFKTYDYQTEELDQYLGTYSKPNFPLKIRIFKKGTLLFAQASGQPEFNLTATEEHIFKFDPAGIIMVFNPEKNELTLKQNGGIFVFKKE
ncbi:MAG: serine hydrolase domain-containing protein [Flavobacteriaceae bacterium]